MASHDPNESSVTTIQDLLKILPKQEQTLQVRMQDYPGSSSSSNDSNNRNRNNSNNHRNSNSNMNNPLYHTLRYDFKPASINSDEPAKLEFTRDGQVTIKAPNVGGSICTFRGQRRPHVKECLLIVDNKTGEVTLQKLTDNITVKATRTIGGSGGSGGSANGNGNSSNGGCTSNGNNMVNGSTNGPAPTSSSNSSSMAGNNIHNSNDKMSIGSAVNDNDIPTNHQSISVQAKIDGPQLSEESSDSNSDSDGSSSDSSDSSAESSSNSSSPNHQGFTF